jgi:hypothetical protein
MKTKILGFNALMVVMLVLTACVPQAAPEPTIDANQLFTQAAMTVVARLTQEAPPATQTPAPTLTPAFTSTPLGGALPTLPPLSTLPSLSTPTRSSLNIADKAMYITQSPSDNATVQAGKVFNITWRLRNTGTTTWNTNYAYRFFAARNKIPTSANGYNLTTSVPPNGEVDITVVATAPTTAGAYDTQWVLTNPEGTNFSYFTLDINVTGTASTGGGTDATATAAPNACSDKNVAFGGSQRNISDGSPLDITMQGGQIYIAWSTVTSGAGTFVISLDGAVFPPLPVSSGGSKWMGSPDQNPHDLTVTVTGAGTIGVTSLYSINGNSKCY